MQSSTRILAIALALAFVLLARAASQHTATAAAIELADGEAAFVDLTDAQGKNEAEHVGLTTGTSSKVVFYVKLDAFGTQVTASTTGVLDDGRGRVDNFGTTTLGNPIGSDTSMVALLGGTQKIRPIPPIGADFTTGPVPTFSILSALDHSYCRNRPFLLSGLGFESTLPWYVNAPDGWGLYENHEAPDDTRITCVTGNYGSIDRSEADTEYVSAEKRQELATQVRAQVVALENAGVVARNDALYTYKDGSKWAPASTTNPALRYTHGKVVGDLNGDDSVDGDEYYRDAVGGPLRPLVAGETSVTGARVYDNTAQGPANDNLFAVVSDRVGNTSPSHVIDSQRTPVGGSFRVISPSSLTWRDVLSVQFTYDIVDVYEAEDGADRATPYPDYTSGYGRALVSSGSDDSGTFVELREVKAVGGNEPDAESNLFRGEATITNTPGGQGALYVQHGDTLTLRVLSANGDRDSADLASATVTVDASKPTISGLTPADGSIISDNTVSLSFAVNEDGAGLDVTAPENVVNSIQLRIAEAKTATRTCELLDAGAVSYPTRTSTKMDAVLAPTGKTYSGSCANVVDTTTLGDNHHGKRFEMIIGVSDLAGNKAEHTAKLTIDTVKPTIQDDPDNINDGVLAGKGWNSDDNEPQNSLNSILVKFTESLAPASVSASDVTVAGYTVAAVDVVGANVDGGEQHNNEYLLVTLNEDLAKNASPSVTVSGVSDVAGNASDKLTRTAKNAIAPTLAVTPFAALLAKDGEQSLSFTSDEALRSSSGTGKTQASVSGPTKGALSITVAAGGMGGSGTFKQSEFTKSGAYGVLIQAVDTDGNPTSAGEVRVTSEDVSRQLDAAVAANSTFTVKPANWPPADNDFDGVVTDEFTARVSGESADRAATGVNLSTGEVTFAAAAPIPDGAAVSISYSYVHADQVIQVDVSKPTLTSVPEDGGTTDYTATIVQFIWDDDEYAGDTYKTVTLDSATHKTPDGESADIAAMLSTVDDKRWLYAPSGGLALGKHEFTLSATDAAGNSAEVTTSFTVKQRAPVLVSMYPGWNLISFRGTPASLDVNDLFSDQDVSVVSQYDGSKAAKWTVWTRDADARLVSLSGDTTIDPRLGMYALSAVGKALSVDIPGYSREDASQVPPAITLSQGWNLVAVWILDRDVTEVAADDYLPSGAWTRAFTLNESGRLESISPGDGSKFSAGSGVWVYASEDGVIVPQ